MEPLYNDVLGIANDILHPVLLKCMEQNLLITNQFPQSFVASLNRGSTVYVTKGELLLSLLFLFNKELLPCFAYVTVETCSKGLLLHRIKEYFKRSSVDAFLAVDSY